MKANDHIHIRPTYLNLYLCAKLSYHFHPNQLALVWQGLSPSPQSFLLPTPSPGLNQVVVVVVVDLLLLLLQFPLKLVGWLIPSGQIGRSSKCNLSRDSALQSTWQQMMAGPTSPSKIATILPSLHNKMMNLRSSWIQDHCSNLVVGRLESDKMWNFGSNFQRC